MATGDISARSAGVEGYYAILTVDGFTTGATYLNEMTGSIPGTFTSGTFTDGEYATQSGGAKAVIVGAQSAGTVLAIKSLDGPANTGNWVGQSSGAVFNATGIPAMQPTANTPYLTVVSEGYSLVAGVPTLGTVTRTVYITSSIQVPYSTATIAGTYDAGTFTDGETVTQAVTSATAVVVGAQSSGAVLRVKAIIGNPNNSAQWTGGSSGATFTASGTPSVLPTPTRDELNNGSALVVRVSLSEPVFLDDNTGAGKSGTAPTITIPAGFIVNTGDASQTSNALVAASVTNNSTLVYPKVVGRWMQSGYERWTDDTLVEMACFQPFGRQRNPVVAVRFDSQDASAHSITPIYDTQMRRTAVPGDAAVIYTYSATIPDDTFTQGDAITNNFIAYPYVGDENSVLNSAVGADGVAAPSADLTPLMGWCDKGNTIARYARVDGVGGSPAVATTPAGAQATPYASWAAAAAGLKTALGGSTTEGGYILMDAGSWTGPGTFTGGNTKGWLETSPNTLTGATEATVIFNTATNQVCNAYLKFKDVTFTGSGAGMLRGSTTTGQLLLESCTINNTSSSFAYQWLLASGVRNNVTAFTQGFMHFGANKGPWGLLRGNYAPNIPGGVQSHVYCWAGNIGLVGTGSAFQATGNGASNPVSDNVFIGWNQTMATTNLWAATWCPEGTDMTKGMAIVGNLVERIASTTQALVTVAGDNTVTNTVNNVYFARNTFVGARVNVDYLEFGNIAGIRKNWYELYDVLYNLNIKTDTFANGEPFTDGVITGASSTMTSATAAFVPGDVGVRMSFDALPVGITTVATRVDATTITLNANATASMTGVNFWMGTAASPLLYGKSGMRTTNWPWMYGCGVRGNRFEITSGFPRYCQGINSGLYAAGGVGFIGDRSAGVSTAYTGNGDYRLIRGSNSTNVVTAGDEPLPGDLRGVLFPDNGTDSAGSLQFNSLNPDTSKTTTISTATTTTLQP